MESAYISNALSCALCHFSPNDGQNGSRVSTDVWIAYRDVTLGLGHPLWGTHKKITEKDGQELREFMRLRHHSQGLKNQHLGCFPMFRDQGVGGSNPLSPTNLFRSDPDTWVTECTGYIGDNLGPNGLSSGSSARVSRSKYPKS